MITQNHKEDVLDAFLKRVDSPEKMKQELISINYLGPDSNSEYRSDLRIDEQGNLMSEIISYNFRFLKMDGNARFYADHKQDTFAKKAYEALLEAANKRNSMVLSGPSYEDQLNDGSIFKSDLPADEVARALENDKYTGYAPTKWFEEFDETDYFDLEKVLGIWVDRYLSRYSDDGIHLGDGGFIHYLSYYAELTAEQRAVVDKIFDPLILADKHTEVWPKALFQHRLNLRLKLLRKNP